MEFPRLACKPHSVHAGFPAPMTISLGRELPRASCSLPEAADLAVQVTSSHLPRDCLCLTLLQVGVTWPQTLLPTPVVSCTTFSPLHPTRRWVCGLFLWPYPSGCPVPGVTRHLTLWSADFPRWHMATAVIRSAWGHLSYHNFHLD